MNKIEAIEFLKQHQPLPDDDKLTKEIIDNYDAVRKYFKLNPDEECIPLFLNSFGYVDGFGVYQLIEDIISLFDREKVVPHLKKALQSQFRGVRYWNTQIAAIFPNNELINELKNRLMEDDFDMRYAAITALEQIGGSEVKIILEQALKNEDEDELKDLLREAIKNI
jgi:hypothetical protein